MASPLVGEGDINDLVIFNVNRVELDDKSVCAVVYALDKETGEEVWSQPLDVESMSSPIALYQKDGKSYIVMGDDGGTLRLMDGFSGSTISALSLGSAIQAFPGGLRQPDCGWHDGRYAVFRGTQVIRNALCRRGNDLRRPFYTLKEIGRQFRHAYLCDCA